MSDPSPSGQKALLHTIVLSAIGTLLTLALLGLLFIYSGAFSVSAVGEPSPMVQWAVGTISERSVEAHAEEELGFDLPAREEALQAGLPAFDAMCVQCHGAPGQDRGWLGKGMMPEPPSLTRIAEERSPAEIHWVLQHGIAHAGMPALTPTHEEEEIREITAFVVSLKDATAEELARLRAEGAPPGSSATPPGGHDHGSPEDGHSRSKRETRPSANERSHDDHGHSHSH